MSAGPQYQWKNGATMRVPADVAASAFEDIRERRGGITAANVLEESRAKSAPLHGEFEWRDDLAAERYRLEQASKIIRSLVVVYTKPDAPDEEIQTRALVSVTLLNNGAEHPEDVEVGQYETVDRVMRDDQLRGQYLRQALRELGSWRKKYSDLQEMTRLFGVVDEILAGQLTLSEAAD